MRHKSDLKKYPWVKFGLYDINIDYWKQDIPTSYFDVILCNNVLHNANNEVKVLGQFKEIAAPNWKSNYYRCHRQ